MTGDLLIGLAACLTGLAAVISAIRNGAKANENRAKTEQVLDAIGPQHADEPSMREALESIRELLEEVKRLAEFAHADAAYQHTRNHDILSAINRTNQAVPLLIDLLQKVLDKKPEDP